MAENHTLLIPTQLDLGQLYDIQDLIQRGIDDLEESTESERDYSKADIEEAKAKTDVGHMVLDGIIKGINVLEMPIERAKRTKADISAILAAQHPEAAELFQDLIVAIDAEKKMAEAQNEEPDSEIVDFEIGTLTDLIGTVVNNLAMNDATPVSFDHAARVMNEAVSALLHPELIPEPEASEQNVATEQTKRAAADWNTVVNRQGWNEQSQIIHLEGFIRSLGLTEELAHYANTVANEEDGIFVGRTVELADPGPDSSYTYAFTGTVVGFKGDLITVEDMDDNCFDVERDEISEVLEG